MNFWTERSIELANQKNYLDELFRVYPMNPELSREIDEEKWGKVESCFNTRNDQDKNETFLRRKKDGNGNSRGNARGDFLWI